MYAKGTVNYNLPQTVDTDKRTWDDVNEAYEKIDAALKTAYDTSLSNKDRLDELEPRVDKCEADIADIGGRMNDVENTVQTYTEVVQDCKASVDALENQVTTNSSSITQLQNTVNQHGTTIGSLNTKVNAVTNDVNSLKTRVTNNETNIKSLRTDTDTNTNNIRSISTDLTHTKSDVSNIQANNTLLANNITSVNTKVNNLANVVCSLNENNTRASREYNVNDFFIYNNTLYRVTVTIPSGSTITPGSNCVTTSITAEITNALNKT